MPRAVRISFIYLLLVLQVGLACVRGQAIVVDACANVRQQASERGALVLSDELEDWSRGSHRHDDLPLHVHMPEDGAVRGRVQAPTGEAAQPVPPTPFASVLVLDGLSWRSASGTRNLYSVPGPVGRGVGSIESLRTIRILV